MSPPSCIRTILSPIYTTGSPIFHSRKQKQFIFNARLLKGSYFESASSENKFILSSFKTPANQLTVSTHLWIKETNIKNN